MITCRDLLQLDSFKGVQLLAGQAGLDHVISWPYPKHTKVISPWVKGGEFVLVSGYELGVNEDELLQLLSEAVTNQLSGLLIEGGINFKTLSDRVIQKAEEENIPLFFASRVVSFLDITRDISSLILESQIADRYTASLLEKVLSAGTASRQELKFMFENYGVPTDCRYQIFLFHLSQHLPQEGEIGKHPGASGLNTLKVLQTMCNTALQQLGLKAIARPTIDSLAYLIYGETEESLNPILETMQRIRSQFSVMRDGHNVTLALSSVIFDLTGIIEGFNQALYTASLMGKGILSGTTNSFSELGSYQFLFYMEDKSFLIRFRDRYLKELYESDQVRASQLLDTLKAYLTYGGNMLRTAEALYIHRNTLQYRLDRIASMTGKNLNDAEARQDFQNALMILNIYPFL